MSDTPDQEPAEYGLVMPFVAVASKGGPYGDDAYTAGYEMGILDATLAAKPREHQVTIHTTNKQQADLIAMRRGYRCSAVAAFEFPEWTFATFIQIETHAEVAR